jgi:hypothetical protein
VSRALGVVIVLLGVLFGGCAGSKTPLGTSVGAGSVDAPLENGGLRVKLDGVNALFVGGIAEADGPLLRITIADHPIGCRAVPQGDHVDYTAFGFSFVFFELARGPGGRFFDGKPVGTPVWFYSPKLSAMARPHLATVSIGAFSFENGAQLRGRLHVDARRPKSAGKGDAPETNVFSIDGEFDVHVCTTSGKLGVEPSKVGPERPLSASLVGMEQFNPKSALALVEHDADNDVEVLTSVYFFDGQVDCAGLDHALSTEDSLSLEGFGASTRLHPLSTPLPSSASFHFQRPAAKRPTPSWLGHPPDVLGSQGWVTFDALAFEAAGHVRGVAHLLHTALAVDGRFDAEVCRR